MIVLARIGILSAFLLASCAFAQTAEDREEFAYVRHQIAISHSFVPKAGMVPDASTASAIAYAVGVPVYGKKEMDGEQPFRTDLKGGLWTVLGTLHCGRVLGALSSFRLRSLPGKSST